MRSFEIIAFAVCELDNPCCLTERFSVQVRTLWFVYCFHPCPSLLPHHMLHFATGKPDVGDSMVVKLVTYLEMITVALQISQAQYLEQPAIQGT